MTGVIITISKDELQELITAAVQSGIDELKFEKLDENKENEFFKIKELANYLKISESKIRQLTMKKKIPHLKQGRTVYYVKKDIDRWLLSNNVEPSESKNSQYEENLNKFFNRHKKS